MVRDGHAVVRLLAAGVVVSGLVLAMGAVPASGAARQVAGVRGAAAAAGTWGTAIEVPGLGALNTRGNAEVLSVSCASAGNCSAGGFYENGINIQFQGFVVSQSSGHWGKAIEVPGLAALNTLNDAQVNAVSCRSAGNCSVGGFYEDSFHRFQGFVVSQVKGTWGKAIEVPGLGALNSGGNADVLSVSCGSAGNCSAGGFYWDGSIRTHGFVVSQSSGHWGKAIEVPGLAALNADGSAQVASVSCASAGNCSAGGRYMDSSGHFQGFVVSQSSGNWGTAIEVPGLAALNVGRAEVLSVSCASAGNCSAGGRYGDGSGHFQGFVVSQSSGNWGTAIEVPGLSTLNAGGSAEVLSVSCASAGNCSAGGDYSDGSSHSQGFVASQSSGNWGTAIEVPGLSTLNVAAPAQALSVSCASAGNCSAGGYYTPSLHDSQGFVASQSSGNWDTAIEVPGLAALNFSAAEVLSVSCRSTGCSAGGFYTDGSGLIQGFVVSKS